MYTLGKKLGSGISGDVYLSEDEFGQVAIKKISKENPLPFDEVLILMELQQDCKDYFLCYKDLYEDSENYYIVTEYLGNYITLEELMSESLDQEKVKKLIVELIRGMEYLHEKDIGHSDINPSNIMVNPQDMRVKYIDFGFGCKVTEDDMRCQLSQKLDYLYLSEYIRRLISPSWGYYLSDIVKKQEEKRINEVISNINPILINSTKGDRYLQIDLKSMKSGIPGKYLG